jgi:hypothetical protein
LQNGLPLPVAPAKLKELQQEHDTLIKSHLSMLRAFLGPDGAAKLDAYLSGEFAPHVSLKALGLGFMIAGPWQSAAMRGSESRRQSLVRSL